MLATVVLFAFLSLATVTDLSRHKIYNWTTYPGAAFAIALSVAQSLLLRVSGTSDWQSRLIYWLGAVSPGDCLAGLLGCGALLLVCFVLFAGQVGGGDVKLMMAMGALLGLERGFEALLWTFVLAAAVAMICLIWMVGPLKLLWFLVRWAKGWLTWNRGGYLTDDEKKLLSPPLYLAPSALMAAVIVRFDLIK